MNELLSNPADIHLDEDFCTKTNTELARFKKEVKFRQFVLEQEREAAELKKKKKKKK